MRIYTVCKVHRFTVLVGPGTLIGELECIHCVAIQDAEYERSRQPCCSRANVDCCGHDDDSQDSQTPARPTWAFGVERWDSLTIESPNYCDAPPF